MAISAEISLQIHAHESQQQMQGAISQLTKEEQADFIDSIAKDALNTNLLNGTRGLFDTKKQKDISDIVSPIFNESVELIEKSKKLILARQKLRSIEQEVAKGQIQVTANGEQKLKLKMNRWFTVITSASKVAQVNSAPLSLRVSSTRSGMVPSGTTKKVSFEQQISAYLAN